MTQSRPVHIVLCSVLFETSPQAIPLGAACIVAALKKAFVGDPAIQVDLLSVSLEDATDSEPVADMLVKKIQQCHQGVAADALLVVGFSVYVWNRRESEEVALQLRHMYGRNLLVFAGGPEITAATSVASPDSVENCFDFLIRGEGETASVQLIQAIKKNQTPAKVLQGTTEDCAKLDSPWLTGVVDPADYNGVLWELSRGCPFSCAYCYESKGEKKVRKFSLQRLEQELDFFKQKLVPQVFVLDPTFNAEKDRCLAILALIEKKLPDAHFHFEVRAEFLDPQLAKAFARLSCSLQIGLQSANPEVLKKVGRNFDRKNFSRKIALLNEADVVFGLDLIYGLPGDTLPSFKDSIDYALSLYPNHLELFRLAVLPGTLLHEQAGEFALKFQDKPPYHVQLSPRFSQLDLLKAEEIAFACSVFYSAGRAVPWFLSLLHPLKIRPAQFFTDFAEWQRCNNCNKKSGIQVESLSHQEIEKMQLLFLELKYEEKKLSFAFPAVADIVRLNGAIARAVGEGEEIKFDLSYHPDDLLGGSALDILSFADETCMENCTVRVFLSSDGPDFEVFS